MQDTKLFAPCGINCEKCRLYLKEKNNCPGCRGNDENKPKTRRECRIKTCENLKSKYCFTCEEFPCEKLEKLDKRYRKTYNISPIENLKKIRKTI